MNQQHSDTVRRLHNLASYGTIEQVDHVRGRVRVRVSERLTGWLPVPGLVGRNFRGITPVREGTQVVLTSPSGDPANAVISAILYTEALPPPDTTGNVDVLLWNDGARVQYDSTAQALLVDVPAGGTVTTHVGAATWVMTDEAITLKVGGSSITITPAGVFLAGPTVGMTAGAGAGNATLSGNFTMTGRLAVTGDVSASGTVMDAAGNSNHHTH
ncbi:phage baseplate assembly protein V (plasmid) [Azospirillum sp. HJ39]